MILQNRDFSEINRYNIAQYIFCQYLCSRKMWKDLAACNHRKKC